MSEVRGTRLWVNKMVLMQGTPKVHSLVVALKLKVNQGKPVGKLVGRWGRIVVGRIEPVQGMG